MSQVFEHILKINGQLIECDYDTLKVLNDIIVTPNASKENNSTVDISNQGDITWQAWKSNNIAKAEELQELALSMMNNEEDRYNSQEVKEYFLEEFGITIGKSTIHQWL